MMFDSLQNIKFNVMTFILVIACLVSAISVVVVRHQNRLAFVELQEKQRHNDAFEKEWGRLKLEYTTWAATNKLSTQASDKLKMVSPKPENIVTVVLSQPRQVVRMNSQIISSKYE